jgi:hypothetical protein
MNRVRTRRRESDLAALAAARAAAQEVWLDETVYADEVLATAIAASARVIGLCATTRYLPDLGEVDDDPEEPSWDRLPRLVSPRGDDEAQDTWEWIGTVIPETDGCPRLWRRLGLPHAKVLCGREIFGDVVEWNRVSNGVVDRYFYYLSGGGQGDFDLLFDPQPATRAGRRQALVDLVDETFAELMNPVVLFARADAVTCRRLARHALDVHGVPLHRDTIGAGGLGSETQSCWPQD